jgi:hypothetical protein
MNPLKVLSCASLMRPVSELPSTTAGSGGKILDTDKQLLCTFDAGGRLKKVTRKGTDIPLVPFREDLDLRTLPDNVLVTADTETPMRAAVEINYVFGLPMPVIDKVGRLIGVVGTPEIFSGILQDDMG